MRLSFVTCVAYGSAKTLTNDDLRGVLKSNYDWGDLPGVGESDTNAENTWLGDLPGMEYNDYQQTKTHVDQADKPMEVIIFNLSFSNLT